MPIQRHQSFHGFLSDNFKQIPYNTNHRFQQHIQPKPIPSFLYRVPQSYKYPNGNFTVSAIRTNPNFFVTPHRVQSMVNLSSTQLQQPFTRNLSQNISFASVVKARVAGRNESKLDIRRTASGINIPEETKQDVIEQENDNNIKAAQKQKVISKAPTSNKKTKPFSKHRFSSLEIRPHKCYSPTFYSMRCKKHAKRRSIVYAILKKPKENTKPIKNSCDNKFEALSDSIQIMEENVEDYSVSNVPKPAPRCKKHNTSEIIYQNVQVSTTNSDKCVEQTSKTNVAEVLVPQKYIFENVNLNNCEGKVNEVFKNQGSDGILERRKNNLSNKNGENLNAQHNNNTVKFKDVNINQNVTNKIGYQQKQQVTNVTSHTTKRITTLEQAVEMSKHTLNKLDENKREKSNESSTNTNDFSVLSNLEKFRSWKKFDDPNQVIASSLNKSPVSNQSPQTNFAQNSFKSPNISASLNDTSKKSTPTLKVSPNFVKPKTESPKGALHMQLQAKLKSHTAAKEILQQNKTDLEPKPNPDMKTLESPKESDDTDGEILFPIPKMPLLERVLSQKRMDRIDTSKVCFPILFVSFSCMF